MSTGILTVLNKLEVEAAKCKACPRALVRKRPLFSAGNPTGRVTIVIEAPGRGDEEANALCAGPVGDFIFRMFTCAGFDRKDLYIAPLVKCRQFETKGNSRWEFEKKPTAEEIESCSGLFHRQLAALSNRRVIVALGGEAARPLFVDKLDSSEKKLAVGRLRRRLFETPWGVATATYHPSYLMRDDNWTQKAAVFSDLRLIHRYIHDPEYDPTIESAGRVFERGDPYAVADSIYSASRAFWGKGKPYQDLTYHTRLETV